MYLDELPPMDLKIISLLERDGTKVKYETTELKGIEFYSNDIAISAGNEAVIESVNFI